MRMASGAVTPQRFVYIPGGFDVLHADHREFIGRCVRVACPSETLNEISIVFGLCTDDNLRRKGPFRPFFPFEWRSSDLTRWAASAFHSAHSVSVLPLRDVPGVADQYPPREVTLVVVKE